MLLGITFNDKLSLDNLVNDNAVVIPIEDCWVTLNDLNSVTIKSTDWNWAKTFNILENKELSLQKINIKYKYI